MADETLTRKVSDDRRASAGVGGHAYYVVEKVSKPYSQVKCSQEAGKRYSMFQQAEEGDALDDLIRQTRITQAIPRFPCGLISQDSEKAGSLLGE
ncbi:hypothetical protein FZEAL_1286 [Fusarium zealandicum]|uniref:Uncharacterized protein n=1 Tax=Fusarium zealandicum TaxID=1053134 RepID=A0A8H4UT24_9HYPO|nr:hypothetical protein FZEAL_1286 [Fusarium zealandicum]